MNASAADGSTTLLKATLKAASPQELHLKTSLTIGNVRSAARQNQNSPRQETNNKFYRQASENSILKPVLFLHRKFNHAVNDGLPVFWRDPQHSMQTFRRGC